MSKKHLFLIPLMAVTWTSVFGGIQAHAQSDSSILQLGAPPVLPLQLVNHTNFWRYHKGTNEPPADWHTVPDASLDETWLTGRGGIGYSDGDDLTTVDDMRYTYDTLYLRQSFVVSESFDASLHVELTMDYDDGYVAYLDGVEVARSSNVPGAPGTIHPHDQGLPSDHSASVEGGAIDVQDLGSVEVLLPAGTHILAVQAINGTRDSSDLSCIADLYLVEGPGEGVGGTLTEDTIWSPDQGTVRVISNVTVPSGVTLTVEAGTVIELASSAGIQAQAGGTIVVTGTRENKVQFRGDRPTGIWGSLSATGAGASLTVQHAELNAWAAGATNNATMLLEDCYVHDYKNGSWAIGACQNALDVTVRRCHFNYYHETLWRFTRMLIEDSLFENADNASSDALDFDGAVEGSIIRRCTFRHGPQTNTDAIDLGSDTKPMLVEDCLMYDFPFDKGISIGETTYEITIRNCLMYGLDSGVAVKDSCTAIINNCTLVNNDYGFRNYNKANPSSPTGGGHITNSWDNILWGNTVAVSLQNSSTLIADHCDIEGSLWPGIGNLNGDPLFIDAAARDYRLAPGSPGIGAGRDGGDLGCRFPVGAPMAASHPSIQSLVITGDTATLQFWADSEKSYELDACDDLADQVWNSLTNVPTRNLPQLIEVQETLPSGKRFYRLRSL